MISYQVVKHTYHYDTVYREFPSAELRAAIAYAKDCATEENDIQIVECSWRSISDRKPSGTRCIWTADGYRASDLKGMKSK